MQSRPEAWVFDADGHVVEPPGMWEERVPREYWRWLPRVHQEDGFFRFAVGDRLSFAIPGRAATLGIPGQTLSPDPAAEPSRGGFDAAARIGDMDIDSIGIAALYPTYGLMIQAVAQREPALALCQAVNDWVADYVSFDRARLVGVGVLPMTDAGDALAEARRCVEQLGFRGVWRRPEQFPGIPALHDESYEPLWEYLAGANASFAFHPGMNGIIPFDYLKDRYGDYYTALHAVHFASEQMMALTTMIAYGILERHPTLKVAFLECGATWAVPYLYRLHEHVGTFGFERGRLTLDPTEYFARQCFVSVEEEEPGLAEMMARYPDSVTFASDYPHGDATFPGSTSDLLGSDLDDGLVRRILRTNALRLYGIEGGLTPVGGEEQDGPPGALAVVGSAPGPGWELCLGLADLDADVLFVPVDTAERASFPGPEGVAAEGPVRTADPWDGQTPRTLADRLEGQPVVAATVWAWSTPASWTPLPFDALDEDTWATLAEEPLTRFLAFLQGTLDHFGDGPGSVVAVVPTIALTGGPAGLAPWATASDGQRALVRVAARNWGARGITVNTVLVTPDVYAGDDAGRTEPPTPPETPRLRAGLRPRSMRDRPSVRADVAPVVRSLCGPGWRSVTGATVGVDGGIWMVP